jgi:hypothetical protein
MENRDYNEDIKINKYKLDRECQEHSSHYLFYSSESTIAEEKVDTLKDNLDYLTGKLDLEFRTMSDPPCKITEGSIKSLINTDERIRDIKADIVKAKKDLNLYKGAVKGFEHRKNQLQSLKDLWCAGYYSDPSRSSEGKEEIKNQRSKLKRRNEHE